MGKKSSICVSHVLDRTQVKKYPIKEQMVTCGEGGSRGVFRLFPVGVQGSRITPDGASGTI